MDFEDVTIPCYKVVRIDENGDRVSAYAKGFPYQITYHPGRKIRAIQGTLGCMAFSTLKVAHFYLHDRQFTPFVFNSNKQVRDRAKSFELWEAEITNPWTPEWILADINNAQAVNRCLDEFSVMTKHLSLADLAKREPIAWAREFLWQRNGPSGDTVAAPWASTICGDTLKLIQCLESNYALR